MYHLYHTPALVLGSTPQGEGSNLITLFTRELGLIRATATSVREERSKLRYGLQDFSYSEVTLVRGREFWRLTNATLIAALARGEINASDISRMTGRICALLRRLLAGEEKNEPLFLSVVDGLRFAATRSDQQSLEGTEIILALRILYFLGYLAPRNEFAPLLCPADLWDDGVISRALLFRALAVSDINESLRQTQL